MNRLRYSNFCIYFAMRAFVAWLCSSVFPPFATTPLITGDADLTPYNVPSYPIAIEFKLKAMV